MSNIFKTEDMTLVTVLKMRGIEPVEMEVNNGGCRWIFDHSDTVRDISDEYANEESYVEPKEFARKWGLVRSEMYTFLGVPARKVRHQEL